VPIGSCVCILQSFSILHSWLNAMLEIVFIGASRKVKHETSRIEP